MKSSALGCHVDYRCDKGDGVADRSRLLRILRETEESDEEYVGRGSNADGDGEDGRHAERPMTIFSKCFQVLNTKTSRRQALGEVSNANVQCN